MGKIPDSGVMSHWTHSFELSHSSMEEKEKPKSVHNSVVLFRNQMVVVEWETVAVTAVIHGPPRTLSQLVQVSTTLHCSAVGWRARDIHI